MHLIVYSSDYIQTKTSPAEDLKDIESEAKLNNRKQDITGVLFFLDNKFIQIIEGDEDDLRALMALIEQDDRHTNIEYLIDCEVNQRGFSQWNMDIFDMSQTVTASKDDIKNLTKSFEENLLPRSDVLAHFYKTLLQHNNGA